MTPSQLTNVPIDEDVAYLIGVLQSDGCIYEFYERKTNRHRIRLSLGVGMNSLPMSEKFKRILAESLNIHVTIRKSPSRENSYQIQTSINRKAKLFREWKKEELNNEISNKIELFGAYLAGLIDGDGHVKIKNNHDRDIPQCIIRIAEDRPMKTLQQLILKFFNCQVHFEKNADSKCVQTCFYISKRNIVLFYKYVYPHLTLKHKLWRLSRYLEMKSERVRI